MRLRTRQERLSLAVVVALGAILVLLASLQYRWSRQVSEAEQARMQAGLETAVRQFRGEFNLELQRICLAFQFGPLDSPGRDWNRYAQRYENSLLTERDSRMVAGVFIWDFEAKSSSQLLRLDGDSRTFEPVSWPASLEILRSERFALSSRIPPQNRPDSWMIFEQIPLLAFPLKPPLPEPGRGMGPAGFIMVELNLDVLRRELFPELTQRYFGTAQGLTYHVAVVSSVENTVLYQSDPVLPADFLSSPDARVPLLTGPGAPPPPVARNQPPEHRGLCRGNSCRRS